MKQRRKKEDRRKREDRRVREDRQQPQPVILRKSIGFKYGPKKSDIALILVPLNNATWLDMTVQQIIIATINEMTNRNNI